MKRLEILQLSVFTACFSVGSPIFAAGILQAGDAIIAIDTTPGPSGGYPGGEAPQYGVDGNNGTKYLNYGGAGTGMIATPSGSSTVTSFRFVTGGDAEGRDPSQVSLYGTNDAIASADNSLGTAENWQLITTSSLSLPSGRNTAGSFVNFGNSTAYSSYKLVIDSVKGSNLMQFSEFELYTGADGAGTNVLTSTIPIATSTIAGYPSGENPTNLLDGDPSTKYLHFGKSGTGFIVTPSLGPSVAASFEIVTAGDAATYAGRNPGSYMIYGTNDAILSGDNSAGDAENWTLIKGDALSLPAADTTSSGEISLDNTESYTSYKVVFDTLVDEGNVDSMQISEFQFHTVPEPSTALLSASALGLLALRRRRQAS
ncbi:PEP-CTERM sorting domain-containing protein [Haloferula sargassicola]|uniref:Ice-binding protein C-terminal domain-containing protein n=1 Tax=Haloferula sargassicola TaxID=490096 RepID=A0ABP9UJ13_9BACT